MLFINLFADGGALLESDPQGDVSVIVKLSQEDAEALASFLVSVEASAALARLFLAGAAASTRPARFVGSALAGGVQSHTTPGNTVLPSPVGA
jgi:hypothetical protein